MAPGPWCPPRASRLPTAEANRWLQSTTPPPGIPWLVEVTQNSDIELAPLAGAGALTATDLDLPDAGEFVQSLAATDCTNPADGGAAICVLSHGTMGNSSVAWLTLFDPATGVSGTSEVYTVAPSLALGIVGTATANLGCGQVELGLYLGGDSNLSSYVFSTDPDAGFSAPGTYPGVDPPALFPWRGAALLINEDPSELFDDATGLGPWQPPSLPIDAGYTPTIPHGYVDATGAVYVGLIAVTPISGTSTDTLNLLRLSP